MSLPLLKRATEDGVTFVLTPVAHGDRVPHAPAPRMPLRAPGPGEQYRFHVDMRKCIGCKCCVVACNEQNGNPAAINWRRVERNRRRLVSARRAVVPVDRAAITASSRRASRAVPVDAYKKDAGTGIVLHSADACIGCQYCTWNCSYGVPQYNPERGVVGKCDMCHRRLGLGQSPACVSACPTGAIQIEIVNVEDLARGGGRRRAREAACPRAIRASRRRGSRCRRTCAPNAKPVDLVQLKPAEPHWPLVVMTVFTQLSVGAFATILLLQLSGASTRLGAAALTSLARRGSRARASTLHLGRPIYAYRALKMWRRSWLSREVLLFTGFSAVACLYAVGLWLGGTGGARLGALTLLFGFGGVTASACIYRVPSRPAWNTPLTLVQFNLTALTLGPLFAAAAIGTTGARWLPAAIASAAARSSSSSRCGSSA